MSVSQVAEQAPDLLYFAQNAAQSKPKSPSAQRREEGASVVMVPSPISATQEGHLKCRDRDRVWTDLIRERKIHTFLQGVNAAAPKSVWEISATDWMVEFAKHPVNTEERTISLACFVIEVLTLENLYDLKALASEILEMMLPKGQTVENYLTQCEVGLSLWKKFLGKCRRENLLAIAHFKTCENFKRQSDEQICREYGELQGRMKMLRKMSEQLKQQARIELEQLIEKVNGLNEQLKTQETAEKSLLAIISEYQTFLEGLK